MLTDDERDEREPDWTRDEPEPEQEGHGEDYYAWRYRVAQARRSERCED